MSYLEKPSTSQILSKSVKCPMCDYESFNKNKIYEHLCQVHFMKKIANLLYLNEDEDDLYKCPSCDFWKTTKSEVYTHYGIEHKKIDVFLKELGLKILDEKVEKNQEDEQNSTKSGKKKRKVTGIVKWFNRKYCFGFITRDDTKEDVYVNAAAIIVNNPSKAKPCLYEGELVEFDVVSRNKASEHEHDEASNVSGLEGVPVKGSLYVVDSWEDLPITSPSTFESSSKVKTITTTANASTKLTTTTVTACTSPPSTVTITSTSSTPLTRTTKKVKPNEDDEKGKKHALNK